MLLRMAYCNILGMKYSVLMSVYKKENAVFFRKAICSMINQTIKPSEIIIVKDGALTDELNYVIDEFLEHNSEMIRIIESKNNLGLGKALNLGLSYCKYDYIARMDTDDISLPNRCEKELQRFKENSNLSIVGSWVDEFIEDEKNIISTRKVPCTYEDIYAFCKRRNPFNHPTVIYKRDDILKVGGYSDLRFGQDYELFGRMLINGYKAENINESLLLFRTTSDTIKRRKNKESIKNYVYTVNSFRKLNYSTLYDLFFVIFSQSFLYILPNNLVRRIYKFIRS